MGSSILALVRRILSFGKRGLAALLAALILQVTSAEAHLLNMSRINIALIDERRVQVTAELDLTRTFGSADAYHAASQIASPMDDATITAKLAAAANAIELTAGDVRVALSATNIVFEQETLANYRSPLEWPRAVVKFVGEFPAGANPTNDGIRVRFDDSFIFEEPLATTLQSAADDVVKSRWLVTFQSSPVIQAPEWFGVAGLVAGADSDQSARPAFAKYFSLGFWHIIPDGLDHLLFVLALVLGMRSIRSLVIILSVYTVAHTLTFAAATLGLLPPAIPLVEPLIILSIVVAALMNLRTKIRDNAPRLLAFSFGLLHGLGFANALTESGLPTEQRLVSLLGFNVGVEAAQLLWVALLVPVWCCYRFPWFGRRIRRPVSIMIAFAGVWLMLLA